MLYELGHHQIELPFRNNEPEANSRLLLWHEGRLLCENGNAVWFFSDHPFEVDKIEFIGLLDNKPYYTGVVAHSKSVETISLRDLALVSETLFMLASRAKGLLEWRNQHQYCGQCGQQTQQIATEFALTCDPCRLRFYPRISPCIIVLITDGEKVLLAQGERHRDRGWYSTLAGFVETGESAEQAVIREVYEEVGVNVKNIQYLNSQTWPFPNQLMLGFQAEYAGGEIIPQAGEIADAAWFQLDDLPKYPPNLTIAGWLIQSYLKQRRA